MLFTGGSTWTNAHDYSALYYFARVNRNLSIQRAVLFRSQRSISLANSISIL